MAINVKELYEKNKIYDDSTEMHRVVAEKLKKVVSRLIQNTDIDINEYLFECCHSDNPNAFYISKDNPEIDGSIKGDIICVSDSLIEKLETEDELAAVISHEIGHFIFARLVSEQKNTIFQERYGDVNSVNIMLNGGYNPRYILKMQEKIFDKISHSDYSFGVHGTSFARNQDVMAALTVKAAEIGDFPKIDAGIKDENYLNFRKNVSNIYQKYGYDTFIEKLMIEKFKTKDLEKIDRVEFLDFLVDIVEKYNLDPYYDDFIKKLKDLRQERKVWKDEEVERLRKIFMIIYNRIKVYDVDKLQKMTKATALSVFGIFKEVYDDVLKFYDSVYDKDKAIEYAEKIFEKEHELFVLKCCFGIPKYDYSKIDFIGKKTPDEQLESYDNENVIKVYRRLSFVFYDDYLVDKNTRLITHVGKDARIIKNMHHQEQILKSNKDVFDRLMFKLDLLTDFLTGKITIDEYKKVIEEEYISFNTGTILPLTSKYEAVFSDSSFQTYDQDDLFVDETNEFYKKIISSKWYDFFVNKNTNPKERADVPVQKFNNSNILIEKIIKLIKYDLLYEFEEAVYKILLTYNEKEEGYKELFQENEYDILSFYKFLNDKFFRNKDNVSEIKTVNNDVFYTKSGAAFNNINEEINSRVANPFAELALDWLSKQPIPFFCDIAEKLAKSIEFDEDSKYLENILKRLNFDHFPKNQEELMDVFDKIYKEGDLRYNYYIYARFLQKGGKADLYSVVLDLCVYDEVRLQSVITDTYAKYISDDDFNKCSLMEKIFVYEYFDIYNLFSEKFTNKNRWIKIIVDDIIKNKAYEYAEKILSRNTISYFYDNTKTINNDLQFFNEREKLINFYSAHWAEKLGKDDGSDEYLKKIDDVIDFFVTKPKSEKQWFSRNMVKMILNDLSNKILSQSRVAEKLADVSKDKFIDAAVNNAEQYDVWAKSAETAFGLLAKKPDEVLKVIDFFTKKLTDDSVDEVLQILKEGYYSRELREVFNKQSLVMLHENFWGSDLPVRAYLMNRLLNSYTDKAEKKIDLIVDMFFDKTSPYYNDSKLVLTAVYNNLQDYERGLILSALISAGQRTDNSQLSNGQKVGQGLKMFLQNKGPAFIKFGQLLSYLPQLDSDIRKELATLRDKADIPSRADLFRNLKIALPESEIKKIDYVGKILGAGSFYITVSVEYDGKPAVLSLLRPYAENLTTSGIDMIKRTIDDLAKIDKKYNALKNIVIQAKQSAESEIKIEDDYEKYKYAKENYEKFKVHTKTADYSPDVADWLAYGSVDVEKGDRRSFKIMEMAEGKSLMSQDWTEQEKHDFACAYVALELSMLLSGKKWDTDRHQGQQNFYNSDFRNFVIGIFDTGAQINSSPKRKDKVMLGYLLYNLARGVKSGKDIAGILMKNIQQIDSVGNMLNVDVSYIDAVQRGLTALSDIMEYQKEIKDEDGNIVQKSKSLTANDWNLIANAIMKSGIVDKTVKRTVVTNVLFDLFAGHFAMLKKKNIDDDGIDKEFSVEYHDEKVELKNIEKFEKSKKEIQKEIKDQQKKKSKFGIFAVKSEKSS